MLWNVSGQWMSIGISLRIRMERLNVIKMDNHADSRSCLLEVVRVWLQRVPSPSWSELAVVLERMDRNDLASQIREKYGTYYITFWYYSG